MGETSDPNLSRNCPRFADHQSVSSGVADRRAGRLVKVQSVKVGFPENVLDILTTIADSNMLHLIIGPCSYGNHSRMDDRVPALRCRK